MLESGVAIEEDYPRRYDVQGLARAKTIFKGWDLFMAVFHGFSPLPVLKEEKHDIMGITVTDKYVKEYPRVANFSGGFSTTHKEFEFHGEGIFQYSYGGRDDNYFDYVGGVTYTAEDLAHKIGHDRIDITAEYAGEWTVATQSDPDYYRSSDYARNMRNNGLGRIKFKYNEDLEWEYALNYEISDKGWAQRLGLEYKLTDDVVIKVAAEFFDGGDGSSFERWEKNDRLICQLEYNF